MFSSDATVVSGVGVGCGVIKSSQSLSKKLYSKPSNLLPVKLIKRHCQDFSMSASIGIPVIDICSWTNKSNSDHDEIEQENVCRQWDEGFAQYGFVVIKGHGIPKQVRSTDVSLIATVLR